MIASDKRAATAGSRAAPAALRAVGYLRRSTDRQEQSIGDQQRAVERYAAQHGLHLVDLYTDDAISGTSSLGRKAFQKMIHDAQRPDRPFSLVVVYDVKRFGRVDNDEAGYYRHLLRQHGVEVRYVSENFSGDGTDDLLRPVKQWQARQESKDLSKVTIRGLLSKSTSGAWMGGAPPYGYDLRYESQGGEFICVLRYRTDGSKQILDQEGKHVRTLAQGETLAVSRRDRCFLVPGDKERVQAVELIFRLYTQERIGFKAIAERLNCSGVPTARSPAWAGHYSGRWATTTVRAILVNPAYAGDLVWNRRTDARFHRIASGIAVERHAVVGRRLEPNSETEWVVVKQAHSALVSRRVWELAQQLMASKPAAQLQRGVNPRKHVIADQEERALAPTAQGPDGKAHTGATGSSVLSGGGWCGPRARFLLSGLMRCARCGSRYEGYTQRGKPKLPGGERVKTYYYACGGYIRYGKSVCRLGELPQALVEETVVDAVLQFYERYSGDKGVQRLAQTLQAQLVKEDRQSANEREVVAEQMEKIDRMSAKLLDHLSAANRPMVDRRLAELAQEREQLEVQARQLERLALDDPQAEQVRDQAVAFVRGLGPALKSVPLAERQAAIRRCVESILVDNEKERLDIQIRIGPVVAGGAQQPETQRLVVEIGHHAAQGAAASAPLRHFASTSDASGGGGAITEPHTSSAPRRRSG